MKRFNITIWEVPGHRLLSTISYVCQTREEAISEAQRITRCRWHATGVTYKVVEMDDDRSYVLAEWHDLLKQQRETRELMTAVQERRREEFYREHKEVLDSLTPEERYEHTVIARKG